MNVTQIVRSIQKPFDADYWAERKSNDPRSDLFGKTPQEIKAIWDNKGKISRKRGISVHKQIDDYLMGRCGECPLFFKEFKEDIIDKQKLILQSSEFPIDHNGISAVIDAIYLYKDKPILWEWKNYTNLSTSGYPCVDEFSFLENDHLTQATLQLWLYNYLVGEGMEARIGNFHDNRYSIYKPKFKYDKGLIEDIIEYARAVYNK